LIRPLPPASIRSSARASLRSVAVVVLGETAGRGRMITRTSLRRGLVRMIAAVAIAAQLLPPATTVVAGLGHAAFHISEGLAHQMVEALRQQRADWAEGPVFVHSHGPDEEPHAHSLPVDLILRAADSGNATDSATAAPAEQRIDKHYPPVIRLLPAERTVRAGAALASSTDLPLHSVAPQTPPPRA
jgi:hypothetical protein